MNQQKEKVNWKEKLRRLFGSASVFWHYFVFLAIVLVMALGIQLLSHAGYANILTDHYLKQTEGAFRQDCKDFSSMLFATYSVPAAVESAEAYTNLQRIHSGHLPETSKTLVLSELQASLRQTMNLTGTAGAEEYFLYFPEYDAVVARGRVFTRSANCFETYIVYEDLSAEDVRAWIAEPGMVRLTAEKTVMVAGKEQSCMTLLVRPSGASCVLGILYSNQTVFDMFSLPDLPEDSYFHLTDSEGNLLLCYGQAERSDCYEFTDTIQGGDCTVVLGISREYFSEVLAPTRRFGVLFLGLTLLLGLLLCAVFSNVGARPLRNLLSSYGLENAGTSRNEISRLADLLASSQLESAAVNQILSKSVLVRVLSGGVLTEKEEQKLLESYPILAGSCRIAIVHTTAAVEDFGQADITELVAEHLPERFACSTVNNLETGVLLPDDTDSLHELAKVLSGVNSQLNVDGLSVLCGVSAPFTGVHSAYAAVRQARFSIPIRESSYIEVYSAEETQEERPGVFSWLTHERLYQAVMKNDRADTVEFIRALAADKYYSAADAKEVFYNVRFVVRSTAHEMQLPLPEADALEYREEMRPKENFRKLEELTCTLFDRLHARQETNANNTMENVVAYVVENFRNPDLSATMAATHFALPVKTVYAAIRDKTGQNMGEFLIDLRMKEAARLLCTTQQSVDEIAVECGYPAQSTFYRVFKKYYGESPSKYRSLH